ncbi:hypothetical protein RCL_jg21905.t1 [Rhizophagus clarus]|uniref:Uncharacterized protein n=1 Tax=Rhizophagus clarus TaxID=94130 RepID=A0A8H3R3R5_9GLOM|nr:hypothetical protein RCL_jg21905.t1 [Rhizophagus clarus]
MVNGSTGPSCQSGLRTNVDPHIGLHIKSNFTILTSFSFFFLGTVLDYWRNASSLDFWNADSTVKEVYN